MGGTRFWGRAALRVLMRRPLWASQGQPSNQQLAAGVLACGVDTDCPSTPAGAGLVLLGETDEHGKEDRSYTFVTLL